MSSIKEEILKAIYPHYDDGDGGAMADAVLAIFKRHIEEALEIAYTAGRSKQNFESFKYNYMKSKGFE
jgi:N-acetylglucosamine kinase-like BadF-type ATPase